ncbi:hypothetical protein ABT174_36325 [Streptomyces sparsogenes]|uniref:hypothetical protein n=1 Tax=Streptomyces sparsogenes TaxID=67365 RepID=UPI00331BA837
MTTRSPRARVLRPGPGRHRDTGRLDKALQGVWMAMHVPAAALLCWTAQPSQSPSSAPAAVASAESRDRALP